jgi:hypothetical protein
VLGVAALPLFARADGRLVLFAGGILTVFQSSVGISAPKVAYFVVAALIAGIATVNSLKHVRQPWGAPLKPALYGSAALLVTIMVASVTGLLNGASLSDVTRDGVTYLIIAAAVPIGLDAAAVLSLRTSSLIVVAVTLIAGSSFMVAILSLRGVSALSVDRLGLPSVMALSVGVAMALVRGLHGRRIRWIWLAFAGVLLAFVLATGSREGLVLLVAATAAVGMAARGRISSFRLVAGALAFVLATAALLIIATATVTSAAFIQNRVQSTLNVIQNGALQDASGVIRAQATRYALDAWQSNWAMGTGFGHVFPDPNPGGGTVDFQLDTPAIYLAKFGIAGCVLLVISIALIMRPALGRLTSNMHRLPEQSIALGAAAVWLAQCYFGAPTEDKGFSLAISMCLLLIGSACRNEANLLQIAERARPVSLFPVRVLNSEIGSGEPTGFRVNKGVSP